MDTPGHESEGRLRNLREAVSAAWAIVPEGEMAKFLQKYLDMRGADKTFFTDSAISRDWFDELDGAEQTALFAILNGAGNITPEQKAPGLGQSLGFILSQLVPIGVAALAGGPPAAAATAATTMTQTGTTSGIPPLY